MTEQVTLGHEFKLYRDTGGGWGAETWALIDETVVVTPGRKKTEAETTTRAHTAKRFRPGLDENDLEFQIRYRADDTTFAVETDLAALLAAFDANTILILAVANGPIASTGVRYEKAEYQIFELSKPEEIDGATVVTVRCKQADTANELTVVTVA